MIRPLRAASLVLLLAGPVGVPATAQAQAATPVSPARTGDAWVDRRLTDIDAYALAYRDAFVDELVRYHRAPRELVGELLARPRWTPGDAYFACSLAVQAGRPCRSVADLREQAPTRDWASIAHDLGIDPGTPAYLEIKRGIVASYDRWARPVAVDAELAPAYPGRARAAADHEVARHAPAKPRAPGAER